MKTKALAVVAALLIPITAAEACGRRYGCRRQPVRPTCAPTYTYARTPAPAYTMTYPSYQTPTAQVAPVQIQAPVAVQAAQPVQAQPTYNYEAAPGGQRAYYYSYNDTGELIVKQWMDWVFRGGRVAGMPAPPAPIIGRMFR